MRSDAALGKNGGSARTRLGFQIQRATAMSPLSSATVTTSRCASPRPWTGRISTRSMPVEAGASPLHHGEGDQNRSPPADGEAASR